MNKWKIILFTTKEKEPLKGVIYDITDKIIYLRSGDRIANFKFDEILSITIAEVIEYDE